MSNIYRHGDLLIKPIKIDKSKLKFLGKFDKFTLAEGETTGHKHLLVAEPKTSFNVYQNDQGQYVLEMEKSGEIRHEEHSTIKLLPDFYVVGNEREYSYFENEIKKVID